MIKQLVSNIDTFAQKSKVFKWHGLIISRPPPYCALYEGGGVSVCER